MLCGLPCTGKSTFVEDFLLRSTSSPPFVVLSTDAYITKEAERLGVSYDEAFQDYISLSTKKMEIDLVCAIDRNNPIIWDQTNVTAKVRRKKLRSVPPSYKKTAVYFQEDFDLILKRNKLRPGKTIPTQVLRTMKDKFTIPSVSEGFDRVICSKDF